MNPQDDLQQKLKERFKQLPRVLQNAITSTDIQKQLRALADSQKLHFDQWQVFENEVLLAILGLQRVEDLEQNIKAHVGTTDDVARKLAVDVNAVVFEPIRQKLERELQHPSAKEAQTDELEAARTDILATAENEQATAPATTPPTSSPPVQPATPPPPVPDIKITRPSDSTAYKPGEASTMRKSIHDDPYREPPA